VGPSQQAEPHQPAFRFATCQIGAEAALKAEWNRDWPAFRFAYSRPGFLTFKLPDDATLADDFDPRSVFARTHGFSLGKIVVKSFAEAAAEVCRFAGEQSYQALHVWQRDVAAVGHRGFEPHLTPAALAAEEAIRQHALTEALMSPLARVAEAGGLVLDCILVEPHEWWIGYHRAADDDSRFPGGLRDIAVPDDAVSRAYVKMAEALAWSGLPIAEGQKFVEIGCSPGGASQALLDRGMRVIGIDPARVEPSVLAHPKFTHVQKRGADVRRREFRGVTWLAADMNVAPDYTLDTVEAIVTHSAVNIRGLLLTLKLLEWKLADSIPAYVERVRSWGYREVRARQLPHQRQEICLAAVRRMPASN
jgi:23S rRNA (cytidine2498-2'-O)-methyltransferase